MTGPATLVVRLTSVTEVVPPVATTASCASGVVASAVGPAPTGRLPGFPTVRSVPFVRATSSVGRGVATAEAGRADGTTARATAARDLQTSSAPRRRRVVPAAISCPPCGTRGNRCGAAPSGDRGAYVRDMPLQPGDKAPSFSLPDQAGNTVTLAGLEGRKAMIYFYPKADTPGCTTQACGLRDILGQVGTTAVIGVSPDMPAKQAKFDQKYSLGFPLLSDEDHAVAEAFEVGKEKSMYGRK